MIALKRAAYTKFCRRNDNTIVARFKVVKEVVATVGGGGGQSRIHEDACAVIFVEFHIHAIHANFRAVDERIIICIKPDAVAESVVVKTAIMGGGVVVVVFADRISITLAIRIARIARSIGAGRVAGGALVAGQGCPDHVGGVGGGICTIEGRGARRIIHRHSKVDRCRTAQRQRTAV